MNGLLYEDEDDAEKQANKRKEMYNAVILTYYYYDGNNWVLTEEMIGDVTDDWYDENGNSIWIRPAFLVPYGTSFITRINQGSNSN
jgi:hypothetical protein